MFTKEVSNVGNTMKFSGIINSNFDFIPADIPQPVVSRFSHFPRFSSQMPETLRTNPLDETEAIPERSSPIKVKVLGDASKKD